MNRLIILNPLTFLFVILTTSVIFLSCSRTNPINFKKNRNNYKKNDRYRNDKLGKEKNVSEITLNQNTGKKFINVHDFMKELDNGDVNLYYDGRIIATFIKNSDNKYIMPYARYFNLVKLSDKFELTHLDRKKCWFYFNPGTGYYYHEVFNEEPDKNKYYYKFEEKDTILEGLLTTTTGYGSPNFGEDPETDEKVIYYILKLDIPINVRYETWSAPFDQLFYENISIIQVVFDYGLVVKNFKNKRVIVEGYLYEHHTGHHHTDVLIHVDKIKLSDKN